MDLPDVDQIEVLKGPQGTLFGRNATGGAIRITTRTPSFTPSGTIDASYGNLNERIVKAFATGPIAGDKLAGSLSAYYEARDGYTKDIVRGQTVGGLDNNSVRGKLLFRPTSDVDITMTGFSSWHRDNDSLLYEPLNGNAYANVVPGAIVPTKPREVAENPGANLSLKAQTTGGSVVAEWRNDYGTLTSTSAYVHYRTFYDTDADMSQVNLIDYPIWIKQRDISQEVVFSSKKFGIAQVVAGAYYYNADGRYDPLELTGAFFGPAPSYGFFRQKTEAYAGFSEVTLTPIENLNIIAGARYSEETRDAAGNYFYDDPVRPSPLPKLGDAKFSSFTPRVSARYTLPTNDNVYFTWSRGFKSGGFNLSGVSTTPFKPEKVDAYEIGLKTDPARLISANISGFWYNYQNQQVLAVNSAGLNFTSNAASSIIKGVDAEISTRPYEGLSFNLGLSYLDAHFKSFPAASYNDPYTAGDMIVGHECNFCGNFTPTTPQDASGNPEPYSPKFTVSLSGLYHKTFDAGDMDLSMSVYHSDKFSFDVQNRVTQGAYTTVAARASFKPQGTKLTLYAYGRNLTDQLFISNVFIGGLGDGAVYAPPRTYGVGLKYQF
jgi:iron complex outermembrane receptor protein